jgi:hypothetical protein
MIQIAYTSIASNDLGSGEIFKIVERSAHNNAAAQLTGFLIFSDNRFFQVIEGKHPAVDGLLRTLESDPRHHSIKIVHRSPLDRRSFPNWRMKRMIASVVGEKLETLAPELSSAPFGLKKAADRFLEPVFS